MTLHTLFTALHAYAIGFTIALLSAGFWTEKQTAQLSIQVTLASQCDRVSGYLNQYEGALEREFKH